MHRKTKSSGKAYIDYIIIGYSYLVGSLLYFACVLHNIFILTKS